MVVQCQLATVQRVFRFEADSFIIGAGRPEFFCPEAEIKRPPGTLSRIERSNGQIRAALAQGRDTAALEDQRQTMIDQISEIVPLREIARERGEVALYTMGGAVLLDGRASVGGFQPAADIDASVTRAGGQLNGLTINGNRSRPRRRRG